MLSLTLENLVHSIRRSPVSDVRAALADLKRVSREVGRDVADLLMAPDPSGDVIQVQLARTRLDVHDKYLALARMCNMHATNLAGDNLMHLAARYNNAELGGAIGLAGKALLGAATATFAPYTQLTPLGMAVVTGNAALVRLFLLLGANPSDPCCLDGGASPLNPLELYAQREIRTPDMSAALRIHRVPRQGSAPTA